MNTAGNWWTRPKRSSAVRQALPSGGNREIDRRVPTRRSAGATPVFRPAEYFRQPSFCCGARSGSRVALCRRRRSSMSYDAYYESAWISLSQHPLNAVTTGIPSMRIIAVSPPCSYTRKNWVKTAHQLDRLESLVMIGPRRPAPPQSLLAGRSTSRTRMARH